MLAVVQHQQCGSVPQQCNDAFERRSLIDDARAECLSYRSCDERAVAQRSELDPPDTIGKMLPLRCGDRQPKPCLADPAGAYDRHLRMRAQKLTDRASVVGATVQRLLLGGQIGGWLLLPRA